MSHKIALPHCQAEGEPFVNAPAKPVAPPWIPFEDRRRARDQKRDAVLRMALKLFLELGYHRTALADVATRLNITKPALYNYFRSKEEILVECFRQGQELYEANVSAVENGDGDGLSKLRGLIRAYVHVIASDFGHSVTRLDDRELSPQARAVVRGAKRRINSAFEEQISIGVKDGSIKECDPKLTTFVITGALNGIGAWYQPEGRLPVDTIADEFVARLTEGLAAGPSNRTKNKGTNRPPATPKKKAH
jgi:AcrR family transcriptional regulator